MSHSSRLSALTKYDVVISGGGPAALAEAWEALQSGKSVLIVSDRKMEFTRVQRVSLYPENRRYFLDMLKDEKGGVRELNSSSDKEDIKVVLELINSSTVAVKDIERFLKRRLDELKKYRLTYVEISQVSAINTKQGILNIESLEEKPKEQQFQFDYLVCADGNAHHAVNVLNQGLIKPLITYTPMAKPTHLFHASAYVTIERADEKKLELPNEQVVANSVGSTWILALDTHSKSYTTKKVKCFFGGEVPRSIFDSIKSRNLNLHDHSAKDHEERAMKHIQRTVQPFLQNINLNKGVDLKVQLVKPSKKYGDKKDKLKLQAFKTEPYLASQAAIEIDGKIVMLSGDALGGANYQLGFGINNSFKHARRAGEVFRGKKTIAQYDKECRSISSSFDLATKLTNWCCFKPVLGWGIQRAVDSYRTEFLKQHQSLINQFKAQGAIEEAEQQMHLDEKAHAVELQPLLSKRSKLS